MTTVNAIRPSKHRTFVLWFDSKVNDHPPLPWLMPGDPQDQADAEDRPEDGRGQDRNRELNLDLGRGQEAETDGDPEGTAGADLGKVASCDEELRANDLKARLVHGWRSRPKRQKVLGALCLLDGLLVAMIILAPLMLPADTVSHGEEGLVTRNDFAHQREAAGMTGWVDLIYWMGDLNCHNKDSRTYGLKGNEMPFCVRDLAIFTGLLLGMLIFFRRSHPLPFIAIVAGLVPIGLDGGTQLVTSYESINTMRLLTGLMAGFTLGLVIAHMGTDISYSRTLRRAWEAGKPYVKPPPEMPRRYYRVFMGLVAVCCWITALHIGWQILA